MKKYYSNELGNKADQYSNNYFVIKFINIKFKEIAFLFTLYNMIIRYFSRTLLSFIHFKKGVFFPILFVQLSGSGSQDKE